MTALFRFATAGSVDDGKSTLVGRLLHDSKSILADQWDAVARASAQRGFAGGDRVDLALLTDGLRAEREQGITIDVAYRYFATDRRSFILADCPGHVQYTRNMVTGSTTADAVVVLVDARKGVLEQTRRHLAVIALLRVPHVVVAVNKIDLVGYDEATFRRVEHDVRVLAVALGLGGRVGETVRERDVDPIDAAAAAVHVIPVSALEGDNVVERSQHTPWYDGPVLLDLLETLEVIDEAESLVAPFRFPVQTVIRPQGSLAPGLSADEFRDYRGFAGQVDSGSVHVGDDVTVISTTGDVLRTRVAGIDAAGRRLDAAVASQSVTLRLADEVDAARGAVIVATGSEPVLSNEVTASLFWLDARPLTPGARVLVKHGTSTVQAIVTALHGRRDLDTLTLEPADRLEVNDIGSATVRLSAALPVAAYADHRQAGAFVVIHPQDGATLAAGTISEPVAGDAATSGTVPGWVI